MSGRQQEHRFKFARALSCDDTGVVSGGVFSLVGPMIFLVNEEQSQIRHRCKHSGAGPDHKARLTSPDSSPGISPFDHRKLAVVRFGGHLTTVGKHTPKRFHLMSLRH
jgi:hypothetical protein